MFRIRGGLVARLFLAPAASLLITTFALNATARPAYEQKSPGTTATAAQDDDDKKAPPYHEFKGVQIGMTADEARQKLGTPTDKSDKQDYFVFNDNESAQVFYDAEKKVFAVSAIYIGSERAPSAKSVLGQELESKPDGSMHRKIDYPKAGFWVAYSRTAGDSPLITVTMMKKP
jgi:hypothetical protein